MQTAMESIKSMVNVNTILGEPVETADGTVIVPVSRVSLGFGAGGSEFQTQGNGQGAISFRGRQRRRHFLEPGRLSCGRGR